MESIANNATQLAPTLNMPNRPFPEQRQPSASSGPSDNTSLEPTLTLTITPGENNAEPGEDRSDNTALISVTAPNKQVDVEVSREQIADAAQRRAARRAIGILPDAGGVPPFAVAAITQSDSREGLQATVVGAAQLVAQRNAAQAALGLFNDNAFPTSSSNTDNQNSSGGSTAAGTGPFYDVATQSLAIKQKQAIFAAVIEKQGAAGNFVDEVV